LNTVQDRLKDKGDFDMTHQAHQPICMQKMAVLLSGKSFPIDCCCLHVIIVIVIMIILACIAHVIHTCLSYGDKRLNNNAVKKSRRVSKIV
jgi:hypothetical protein